MKSRNIVDYGVWMRKRERDLRALSGQPKRDSTLPVFSMAFQPIVHVPTRQVFAYESLVRSADGKGAASVLNRVALENIHRFDKECRSKAIELATRLQLTEHSAALAVNVNPVAAIEQESHVSLTCKEAEDAGFPLDRLILEFVEDAEMYDPKAMRRFVEQYQAMGIRIAIDDFGAGYSGLNLLVDFRPDIVKLDMGLVSKVDTDPGAAVVLKAIVSACNELAVEVVAEGVERLSTCERLLDMGVPLQQGYLFARPGFEALPKVTFPKK